eukprot:288631_1
MATPSLAESKTNDYVSWNLIAQTLTTNLFFPPNESLKHARKLTQTFTQHFTPTVNRTYLINQLCCAYYTDNDEPFIFYKPLTQHKYTLDKRHQFYHILLHQCVRLSELNAINVVQILPRIIQKHIQTMDTNNIQRIVKKEHIDGSKLRQIVRNHRFAEIFSSCSASTSDSQWKQIRFYIKGWKRNLSPITIDCIPNTLQECDTHHLILVVYIIARRHNYSHTSNMKSFFTKNKMNGTQIASITSQQFMNKAQEEPYRIPQAKANIIFNEIQSHFDEKECTQRNELDWYTICDVLQKHHFFNEFEDVDMRTNLCTLFTEYCREKGVDWDRFRNDLCGAYDETDDDQYLFYRILEEKMHFQLDKRRRFYVILLFHYLKLSDLSQQNIRDLLPVIIRKFNHNIDETMIQSMVDAHGINGVKLQGIVNHPSSDELKNTFIDLPLEEADWTKTWQFIKQWNANQTLEEEKAHDIPLTLMNGSQSLHEDAGKVEEEEEEYKGSLHGRIRHIKDCSDAQMMYVVNRVLDETDKNKVIEHKETFRSYLRDHPMDGQRWAQLKRKEFTNQIANHFGDKTLNGGAGQLYSLIQSYKVDAIDWPNLDPMPGSAMDEPFQMQDEKDEDDEVLGLPPSVHSMKDCDAMEVRFILKTRVLSDPKMRKADVVVKNETKIIDYFTTNNINGQHMMTVSRKTFVASLSTFVGDKKLKGKAGAIYKALTEYDPLKEKQESVKRLSNDPAILSRVKGVEEEQKEDVITPIRKGPAHPNVLKRMRSFHCAHKIPETVTQNTQDPYPSYIYKSIWQKSEDENLEMLVDACIRKIETLSVWQNAQYIEELYDDGLFRISDDDEGLFDMTDIKGNLDSDKTYFHFVWRVYKEAGGNTFFDDFIKRHYKREIQQWRHYTESRRVLKTNEEIGEAFRKVTFDELDINKDQGIDFREFQKHFRKLGYFVEKKTLKKIFDDIDAGENKDKIISLREYKEWKRAFTDRHKHDDEKELDDYKDAWYVYYDEMDQQYIFEDHEEKVDRVRPNCVAKLDRGENDMEWAIYKPFGKKKKEPYKRNSWDPPNGHWIILSKNEDLNKQRVKGNKIKEQMAPIHHLDALYRLLHHYKYTLNLNKKHKQKWNHDNSPLWRRNWTEDISQIQDEEITFCIDEHCYKLTWWNGKGKNEANAISLQNVSRSLQNGAPRDRELHYMMFKAPDLDSASPNPIIWQWYDNNEARYKEFTDQATINQLEVSFLSNVKQNFDPARMTLINHVARAKYKFNHCLLTKLKEALSKGKPSRSRDRDYVFRVTFDTSRIYNMEQVCFDHETTSPFPRNLRRMVDNRNSLEFLYRNSDSFVKTWQIKYRLYTEQQQLYFFAFMVSIVAMMKYIDIEFANQPVVIPFYLSPDIDDVIEELIQPSDVVKEQKISAIFEGCLIPPSGIWSAATDKHSQIQPSKTGILRKAIVTGTIEEQYDHDVYIQYKDDYPYLYFAKPQAEFMRLLECVRKYALEFEAGSTEYKLWPWYRNSFHSNDNDCKDFLRYDELVYKHNFAKAWSLSELSGYLKGKDGKTIESNDKKQPIRFKRKFAAEMLLAPHTISRNINLIRNQLHPLFSDIMDKALTPVDVDAHEEYMVDAITTLTFKHDLTKRCKKK